MFPLKSGRIALVMYSRSPLYTPRGYDRLHPLFSLPPLLLFSHSDVVPDKEGRPRRSPDASSDPRSLPRYLIL
jgi:acetylornithine deacetylase/succinyl-diaminopimelate desuccinylase-like protein